MPGTPDFLVLTHKAKDIFRNVNRVPLSDAERAAYEGLIEEARRFAEIGQQMLAIDAGCANATAFNAAAANAKQSDWFGSQAALSA